MVEQTVQAGGLEASEIVQPSQVILAIEREAAILDATIEGCHLVRRVVDDDAPTEKEWCEDDAAVRETQLSVLKSLRAGLARLSSRLRLK